VSLGDSCKQVTGLGAQEKMKGRKGGGRGGSDAYRQSLSDPHTLCGIGHVFVPNFTEVRKWYMQVH